MTRWSDGIGSRDEYVIEHVIRARKVARESKYRSWTESVESAFLVSWTEVNFSSYDTETARAILLMHNEILPITCSLHRRLIKGIKSIESRKERMERKVKMLPS